MASWASSRSKRVAAAAVGEGGDGKEAVREDVVQEDVRGAAAAVVESFGGGEGVVAERDEEFQCGELGLDGFGGVDIVRCQQAISCRYRQSR